LKLAIFFLCRQYHTSGKLKLLFAYLTRYIFCLKLQLLAPIPIAAQAKAQVSSHFTVEIANSNPTEGTDIRLLCLLCFVSVAAFATS
jgi:hypothetical protein